MGARGNRTLMRSRKKLTETEPEIVTEPTPTAPKPKRTRGKTEDKIHAATESVVNAIGNAVKRVRRTKTAETTQPDLGLGDLEPTFRTPATRAKKAPVPARVVAEDMSELAAEFSVGEIAWRPRQEGAKPKRAPAAEVAVVQKESTEAKPREGRQRRKPAEKPVEEVTEIEDPEVNVRFRGRVEKPEPIPELPVKPVKPLIDIPEDAPQVVVRDGVPILVRNRRVYPPISFFGAARDEQRAQTVLDQMKMAGEAGVHIHSHIIEFDVDPAGVEDSCSVAAYLIKKTLEVDPEAQVLLRVVFGAPKGWADKYPDAAYKDAHKNLAEPSICDDDFWSVAKDCLSLFVKQLRMLPMKDSILGVHLDRGEWFFSEDSGYDTSKAAHTQFRDWARTRYFNDIVPLRASWFDGDANFDTLQVPSYAEAFKGDRFVRTNRKERQFVDYHLFLSDQTVERIAELAYTVKEASEGYFLVGVSYGYTFEWSHAGSGHLSLGKLLRSPEIDFVAGPPSYRNREPGGSAGFPGPIDSIVLNGKLYLSEEDFKTSIGTGRNEPDDFNPQLKTPQALDNVHWRGVGLALTHNSGLCWMDLWGNGWLKTPSTWARAKQVIKALIYRMASPQSDPDVAVFIDERSLAYITDQKGFSLLVQNVRESIMRAGMSAGFYLLSDLQHREQFPDSKLYIFVNAWDVRPGLRAAIKQRLQRDNKVLFWLYASGLFDSGRECLERAREVTGIALKPQPFHSRTGTTIVNRRHPLCEALPDKGLSGASVEPSFFAIPDEGIVLGEYTQTGLPSFVLRDFRADHDRSLCWKSVFLGEPLVTSSLLRSLGQIAGAHVWSFADDVVHVRPPFLSVHCTGAGPRTITLPNKWSAYDITDSEWVSHDSTSLKFHGTDGETHVFLVGVKEEIEHILSCDPAERLHLSEPIVKSENTRVDSSFDVSIMRLDEWMEGTAESDDLISDDLLFKPRLVEEELANSPVAPPSPAPGIRRRRDRTPKKEDGRMRGANVEVDDDSGLGVMFRKRE